MKFGHRFATVSRDAWWSTCTINYKQLKKTLKMPATLCETEGAFLSSVLREVQKVRASQPRRRASAAP